MPFLTKLAENITHRFQDADIIQNLSVLDTSVYANNPPLYGTTEIEGLADHFGMNSDELQVEWLKMIELLEEHEAVDRTLLNLHQFIHAPEHRHLGLSTQFPLLNKLLAVALCLPLSTACVENTFSQVSLIKSKHRNRLSQCSLQRLLPTKAKLQQRPLQESPSHCCKEVAV